MASFYSNENFPLPAVHELRRIGHDVLTSLEAGNAGRAVPDEDVLAYAAAQRRAVITLNRRDFIRLHQLNTDHAGIVVCSYDRDYRRLAERVDDSVRAVEQLAGTLIRVNLSPI